mmetsp:Transcript_41748/g.116404  ORF Transcript_41748/g.116404 Transcript_41748/m.116404 type:complete len:287 (-) Transcript_41748:61-921(-)
MECRAADSSGSLGHGRLTITCPPPRRQHSSPRPHAIRQTFRGAEEAKGAPRSQGRCTLTSGPLRPAQSRSCHHHPEPPRPHRASGRGSPLAPGLRLASRPATSTALPPAAACRPAPTRTSGPHRTRSPKGRRAPSTKARRQRNSAPPSPAGAVGRVRASYSAAPAGQTSRRRPLAKSQQGTGSAPRLPPCRHGAWTPPCRLSAQPQTGSSGSAEERRGSWHPLQLCQQAREEMCSVARRAAFIFPPARTRMAAKNTACRGKHVRGPQAPKALRDCCSKATWHLRAF